MERCLYERRGAFNRRFADLWRIPSDLLASLKRLKLLSNHRKMHQSTNPLFHFEVSLVTSMSEVEIFVRAGAMRGDHEESGRFVIFLYARHRLKVGVLCRTTLHAARRLAESDVVTLECSVDDGRTNLEHEVRSSWRPAHLRYQGASTPSNEINYLM